MMPEERQRPEKPPRSVDLSVARKNKSTTLKQAKHSGRKERVGQNSMRGQRNRALEATAKLGVSLVLAVAAVSGLVRLLPLYQSVRERSRVMQTEVKRTEERVNRWQREFNRAFDPGQAKTVMQEESYRVAPQRRPIVLIEENK
ncbi:MAG: hypothetical protein AB4352_29895 [Hormoscilla sp.]